MNWEISSTDKGMAETFSRELNIPLLLADLLINRGITSLKKAGQFLNPSWKDLHDPFLMKDMEKAVKRVRRAIQKKENICIYGDYDVDGICASALLGLILQECAAHISFYIPHRLKEGYGINMEAIRKIAEEKVKLIITVDCGITAREEIELANSLGMEVIVLDHHQASRLLPPACALIDPMQGDCSYPFKGLAGVGVAFKFAQAMLGKNKEGEEKLKEHLDLVILGTIADRVSIHDENRVFLREGKNIFSRTKKPGIRSLMKLVQSSFSFNQGREFSFSAPGQNLISRLNAAGRMGDARRGLHLLLAHNRMHAHLLSRLLEEENTRRQKLQSKIWNEVQGLVKKINLEEEKIIILSSENWHRGVIGIIASRLVETYHRPAMVMAIEQGRGYASSRSMSNVNIMQLLDEAEDLLFSYGGHRQAAGFIIEEGNIAEFKKRINRSLDNFTLAQQPGLKIDRELKWDEVQPGIMRRCLDALSPFGQGNAFPLFSTRNLCLSASPEIIGNRHLRLSLSQDGIERKAIGLKMAEAIGQLKKGDCLDIAYTIHFNEANECELHLADFKKS